MIDKHIPRIYNVLFERFGPQLWWPGDSPWEICLGAVLTQNTNWGNVEKAIANLKEIKSLCPRKILAMKRESLEEALRPSGYFKLKSVRLSNVARWWLENVENDKLKKRPADLAYWRDSILSVNGVGPETADSVLLYSFGLPTFVIDAYTRRIMHRHFNTPENASYDFLRDLFMDNLPHDAKLFNEYHALFVRLGKELCRKNICLSDCPLQD